MSQHRNLTLEEYAIVKEQSLYLCQCPIKNKEQHRYKAFASMCESLRREVHGNIANLLSELRCYVLNAMGRVTEKERRISFVIEKLYVIEGYVK